MTPTLQIVVASTRPGRVGTAVGEWARRGAESHAGFDLDYVDLMELDLPFLDEPHHPRLGDYSQPHTKAWSARVERADAFLLVMPEYNHGFNAPLKNALDFLHREWQRKPVGIVSYGGVAGGTRAAQMIKPVLLALQMVPVYEAVTIPFIRDHLDSDGAFLASEEQSAALATTLEVLIRITGSS